MNSNYCECEATPQPSAEIQMLVPPPICLPTEPEPVVPLQLPKKPEKPTISEKDVERFRYANFYNNYNVDYHSTGTKPPKQSIQMKNNVGKYCECYEISKNETNTDQMAGCPTGFKPCRFKMTPPSCPFLPWHAELQPCPPKPKKKNNNFYVPEPCTKICCKHWKPKDPPCIYDRPCRAHCYNHPPEMRAIWHYF